MKRNIRTILQEDEGSSKCNWQVINILAEGFSESMPDAATDADDALWAWVAQQPKVDTPIPRTMDPNPNPEVVPTPLTKEERNELYDIVYGAHAMYYGHHYAGQEKLEEVSDKRYLELLIRLSNSPN